MAQPEQGRTTRIERQSRSSLQAADAFEEYQEERKTLGSAALEAFREQYKRLSDNWSELETKGQGNAAIAGIFIAGAFAYLNGLNRDLHKYEKILLVAAIVSLLLSVGFSLLVLRIRRVSNPPDGDNANQLIQHLLGIQDAKELLKRLPLFVNDQVCRWRIVNCSLEKANTAKARHLQRAQGCLAIAILIVATIMTIRILILT